MGGLRKPAPLLRGVPGTGQGPRESPRAGLTEKEVGHAPRGLKKDSEEKGILLKTGGPLEWDAQRELGVSPGRRAAGPGGRLRRKAKSRLCPTPGGRSGETTPRGAGGARWAAAAAGAAATARPARGGSRQGRGLGPWKRALCKDRVQQDPGGPSQDGLGRGSWSRDGQGQRCSWPPPTPRRADLTCVPTAANGKSGGAGGYHTPELRPPSAEPPEFSSFSGSLSPPL